MNLTIHLWQDGTRLCLVIAGADDTERTEAIRDLYQSFPLAGHQHWQKDAGRWEFALSWRRRLTEWALLLVPGERLLEQAPSRAGVSA